MPSAELAISSLLIGGPYNGRVPKDSPSRQRIFVCRPANAQEDAACATKILSTLARRAYRRQVTTDDIQTLVGFFQRARANGDFDTGIRAALERLLTSPDFLFRIEADPDKLPPGTAYRLSDVELASRLSFFLWSSIPDDELLDLAIRGRLRDAGVLDRQVRRMLADTRSRAALVDNFFGQWLQTRNVWLLTPDANTKFPWFDDNLRTAIVRETELFLDDQLSADRGIAELLTADSTFLNEQLARHYGVSGVYGSHFRRVTLADENRWGLLGKASVLAVTSYPTRTSPTIRGKWLLENILAAPVPPPPPNANTNLDESTIGKSTTVREMLEQHRANPVCASCHARMDPLGFSLENFDAVGQWRTTDGDAAIDATGVLLDGTKVDGPAALRRALVAQKEQFVRTVTGKLLTYAIGRQMEYSDAPAIRAIVRASAVDDYRWSSSDPGHRQEPAVSDEEVAVMIVTKKAISRRTVLRGMGTAVALPLLDAMIPALTAQVKTPARPVRRLGVVYHPNGVIYENWLPKGSGRDFVLSRTLAPLEPFRNQLIVVTGLSSHQAEALGDGGGDHSRASGSYLTGVHVKKSDSVVENGISMDQIAARALEKETQLSSLELTADDNSLVGACDVGYSCAYSSTLSWRTPTLPLMAENNPRVVFERLFGSSDSTDAGVRASRLRQDRSILDSVTSRVRQLQQKLGPSDTTKLSDYLESLRDTERRIQKAEEQRTKEGPDVERPSGVPDGFEPHVQLLYDLQVLAYQVRSHAGDHFHVRPGTDRPAVSADRDSPSRIIRSRTIRTTRRRWRSAPRFRSITWRCLRRIWRSCVRHRTATARCSIT